MSASGPCRGEGRGKDDYGAPPLYHNMIPVDERSLSDGEDVLMPSTPVSAEAERFHASPLGSGGRSSSQNPWSKSQQKNPGVMRQSKTRSLRLPLGADTGEEDKRRRSSRPALPLLANETEHGIAELAAGAQHRRASVSCVSLSAIDVAALGTTPTRRPPRREPAGAPERTLPPAVSSGVPPLAPPNANSTATTAVFERTNFMVKQPSPPVAKPRDGRSFPVKLHVYDLSGGLLHRYSEEIIGKYVPGMYHSAIVCYGMEFYFEGGIGVAGEGRTRFGSRFESVPLGSTTKPLPLFMEWIENSEVTTHQIHDYDLTRHNCHHFCDEAAGFLLGYEHLAPRYVFTTTEDLLRSEKGAAVRQVMDLITRGTQSALAHLLHARILERQGSLDMILHAVTACGVLVMPPTAAVLFRVADRAMCKRFFADVEPYIEALVRKQLLKTSSTKVYNDFSKQLLAGDDTLYGHNVLLLVDIFAEILVNNPLSLWGPPLEALRSAVLHKSVAAAVVFHPRLLRLLLLASRDLPRLLPAGRLAHLRLLCNLASSPHGAVVHEDSRFAPFWVSAVGQGLIDDNGMVVYTAACLANNLASSIVTMATPSLRKTLSNAGEKHHLICLLTIALYNVNYRSLQELPEPSFNMLLLAVLKIMSSSTVALERVVQHSFQLRYAELLQRAQSNESRALLCILKTLEDLYRW